MTRWKKAINAASWVGNGAPGPKRERASKKEAREKKEKKEKAESSNVEEREKSKKETKLPSNKIKPKLPPPLSAVNVKKESVDGPPLPLPESTNQ